MKLSKAQLVHIQARRKWMEQREKDIRSFSADVLYGSDDLCRELGHIYQEQNFYNLMIQLHNVEVKAEKALEGTME